MFASLSGMFSKVFAGGGGAAGASSMMSMMGGGKASSGASAAAPSIDTSDVQLPGSGNASADRDGDLCGVRDSFTFDDSDVPDGPSPQDTWTASSPDDAG